jgi:predicted nucleic acid-binding protein
VTVVDASLVVAALVDDGADGRWAEQVLAAGSLVAPHLMPVEVANILRRLATSGVVSADVATLAHADLLALRVSLVAYEPLAERAWELRDNVTIYDGSYVALAERLAQDLATLDRRLAQAPGPTCRFLLPPSDPPIPSSR